MATGGPSLLAAAVIAIVAAQSAGANELATVQGTIAISTPATGTRSPACAELMVEARDGLDNHLIGQTQPTLRNDGECAYALSVPAQSAVWIRVRPVLVSAVSPAFSAPRAGSHTRSGSVQIRFRVIAPTTFFFEPGEKKNVQLTY
jgi:hypothetical protein